MVPLLPRRRAGGTLQATLILTAACCRLLPTAVGRQHQFVPVVGAGAADFNEHVFRRKVSSALSAVTRILDTARSPRLALDHDEHTYDDKYALAEFLTNSALAASANALDRLGLGGVAALSELKKAAVGADRNRSVTLRFEATETCDFVEEKEVEVESTSQRQYETYETTEKGDVREEKKTRSKVVNTVKQYHWSFGLTYSITAYAGSDPNDAQKVTLTSRSASTKIIVGGSQKRPRPDVYTVPAKEVDLTWFLAHLNLEDDGDDDASTSTFQFSIDRDAEGCHTPRRNDAIGDAEDFFRNFRRWGESVGNYFTRELRNRLLIGGGHGRHPSEQQPYDLIKVESMQGDLFVPVLPLFEASRADDEAVGDDTTTPPSSPPLLSGEDTELLLDEQSRSIDAKVNELVETFPSPESEDDLVSSAEASLALVAKHCSSVCDFFCDGLDSIEGMLRSQLERAIGKELKPSDFDEFLRFYYGKLFKEPFVPEPFVYAIRRPHHYPDGTLSIESDSGARAGELHGAAGTSSSSSSSEPIVTTTRKIEDAASPMYLPLSAATTIEFSGDRYLHAWVRHDFSGSSSRSGTGGVNLVARARQFSSFMLVIGTIAGPDSFNPREAIILQNKDEVLIPLLLEQLPTPQEFKDAVESLSPEQRRFAEAFRDMQLSTSVFGVLVIQLKPQLESVLGLPEDSLTKEIRLTQDLLSLFMEFQIPSDLFSFDGSQDASAAEKVARVKAHVAALKDMIEDAKKEELEEEERKAEMAKRKKQAEAEEEADMDYGGHGGARQKNRILRAQANRAMPEAMMMAAGVADDMMVSAAGVQEFGEMRMMGSRAAPEDGAHLRAHRGMEENAAQSAPPGKGGPTEELSDASSPASGQAFDFTQVPKQLDHSFGEFDDAAALRPTKIKAGETWTKKFHTTLLTPQQTKSLGTDEQKTEKNRAFDLLDALSKSGALPLSYTELHVMVAATHSFDTSLVDTVIQSNVNPIEKVEKSLLIVASTIHGLPVADLVSDDKIERIGQASPALLDFNQNDEAGNSARTE